MKKIYNIFLLILLCFCVSGNLVMAQCFDMSDLYSSNVTCQYGTFNNPYAMTGVISGRHTVMTNLHEKDPYGGFLVVPTGETSSVRLGNNNTNAQAEAITYTYTVDDATPILLLKYAAVMENPGHPSAQQPRLHLEVMDQSGTPIDPDCSSFDFIASESLGWKTGSGGELYRPWTNIGVDLSAYIGQTIKIRLTNYDCSQGGHFGYAYIHLSCVEKQIEVESCASQYIQLTAPSGFNYQWYYMAGTTRTNYSVQQSISVPVDGKEYFCDVSQVGKSTCSFTTSAMAKQRIPIADFSIQKKIACVDTLYLTNLSGVSEDGITKNVPLETCEYAEWDLGDGRKISTYNLKTTPIYYDNSGEYTITLTAYLDSGCYHSVSQKIYVHGTNDPHESFTKAIICQGEEYIFGGQTYTEPGNYVYLTQTIYQCDSMAHLELVVNPSYLKVENIRTCDLEKFYYRGHYIEEPGTYDDTLKTVTGCDSIIRLNYIINPTYLFTYEDTLVEGATYKWRGRDLKYEGVYWDSLHTALGCDSIYKLTLHQSINYYFRDTIVQCGNEPIIWREKSYSVSGVYYDRYKSCMGADSVYVLNLTMHPSYFIRKKIELCEGQVFDYRGISLTAPCVYYDTLVTEYSCDSILQLILTPASSYHFEETRPFTQGGSIQWHGRVLSVPGVYYDSLVAVLGCDSVYKLTLVERKDYHYVENYTTCANEPYTWHGNTYHTSGTYYDNYISVWGTDSTYELNLTVYPARDVRIINVNICEGNTFIYQGKSYTSTDIILDTLYNQYGCDSIVKIILHESPKYLFQDNGVIAQGSSYLWRNKTYTNPGVYWDSLTTVTGCDSVYRLQLKAYSPFYQIDTAITCGGGTYFWHNQSLNKSGIYYDKYKDVNGVDSIYKLYLKINPRYFSTKQITCCPAEEFLLRGVRHRAPEVFMDTVMSADGCDSICEYILTAARDYHMVDTIIRASSGFYKRNNTSYAVPGHYTEYYQTVDGCDSIYEFYLIVDNIVDAHDSSYIICQGRLPVTINGKVYTQLGHYRDYRALNDSVTINYDILIVPEYQFTINKTLCSTTPYQFAGQTYTKPGTYTIPLQTQYYGCDSTYTLNLKFLDPIRNLVMTNSPEVCADDSRFVIDYSYVGSAPVSYSVLFDTVAVKAGFVNILNAAIPDTLKNEIPIKLPVVDGSYCRPDYYDFELQLDNGTCAASSCKGQVLVRYPASIIEQNWSDVVATKSNDYNGGYFFSRFQWMVNGQVILNQTGSNLYLPNSLKEGDVVVLYPTRSDDGKTIPTCPLTIMPYVDKQSHPTYAPSSVHKASPRTHVFVSETMSCTIYNTMGQLIEQYEVSPNSGDVDLPPLNGVYLLILQSKDGQQYNFKVIVE